MSWNSQWSNGYYPNKLLDLPHRSHLRDILVYSRLFLVIKSAGLLLFVCFLDLLFFKITSHRKFFVVCFELENTFAEIICWRLDNDCLGKSIASENRSRFNISLRLEIVIFISYLGNYQESSYCKNFIRKYLLNY